LTHIVMSWAWAKSASLLEQLGDRRRARRCGLHPTAKRGRRPQHAEQTPQGISGAWSRFRIGLSISDVLVDCGGWPSAAIGLYDDAHK
jgi:hypothetical protein